MPIRGALKGLGNIKQRADEKKAFSGDESPFVKLSDGESTKIRFVQELDESSSLYNERRGLAVVVNEHVPPGQDGYKRRAVCTIEEENRCWGCEQTGLPEIGKKWKPKMRLYGNVIVRGENGEPDKVKVLAQGFSDKSVGGDVVNLASDPDYGTLGGQDCRLSRKGSGMNDTSYNLIPLPPKKMTAADEKHEIIDLSKFVRYVSYDQQADYYTGKTASSDGGNAKDW